MSEVLAATLRWFFWKFLSICSIVRNERKSNLSLMNTERVSICGNETFDSLLNRCAPNRSLVTYMHAMLLTAFIFRVEHRRYRTANPLPGNEHKKQYKKCYK